jgi:prevent-host-death family protein
MLEAIAVTAAREKLLPLLDKVEEGAYRFIITRHNKPVAVVMSYEDYSRMTETLKFMENRAWSQRVGQGLDQARQRRLVDITRSSESHD